MKVFGLIMLFSSFAFVMFMALLHASRRDDTGDEQSDPHLIGDVPSIHPEFHSTANRTRAK